LANFIKEALKQIRGGGHRGVEWGEGDKASNTH